jgi:hypothetical protein
LLLLLLLLPGGCVVLPELARWQNCRTGMMGGMGCEGSGSCCCLCRLPACLPAFPAACRQVLLLGTVRIIKSSLVRRHDVGVFCITHPSPESCISPQEPSEDRNKPQPRTAGTSH